MAAFTALAIGSLAMGAYQAYQQHKAGNAEKEAGKKQREASESQAQLADYNAQVAELQASDSIDRGQQDANRFRTQVRGIIGGQRAAAAAGNVDVSFGSAVDVQADSAYLGKLDEEQIKLNAAREAWGFRVQAEDLRKRAEIARKEGVYLEAAGRERAAQQNRAAVGTLLGTGASLLQTRYLSGRA